MNKSHTRILAAMLGVFVALAANTPARATPGTLNVVLETYATVYRLPQYPPEPFYPGDEVQFTVSLHNDTDTTLSFWDYGRPWNVLVYAFDDAMGHEPDYLYEYVDPVWQAVASWHTGPPFVWLELGPGEEWQETRCWDLKDDYHGLFVPPGQYELVFRIGDPTDAPYTPRTDGLVVDRSQITRWVTVVPEPGTLGLTATGCLYLLRRRRA